MVQQSRSAIELLSPAKNLLFGQEAINHGADALYIGASQFGARNAAGNSIGDIEKLTRYAHMYGAKVYATVNTSLFDGELEKANQLICQLYNIGVDAVIIQDLGLLETNLPPIALHASTQINAIQLERILFLEKVGFQRIVLGRELSLQQIQTIRNHTSLELETFIQGALCVCYSGQCYLSQSLNGHSGNRGNCSQPCRSTYDLYNGFGILLKRKSHLLSLKDFNASQHIEKLLEMGISSFKIEGRLKDLAYVKNVTAYYRNLLDAVLEGKPYIRKTSSGRVTLFFLPDLERTFNRGFTDYFLEQRKSMASLTTQKSIGKRVGNVIHANKTMLILSDNVEFMPGDGICYYNKYGLLEGCLVNRVEEGRIWVNKELDIQKGTIVFRNNDFAFEKLLQNKSAERKIELSFLFSDTENGFFLEAIDEEQNKVIEQCSCIKEPALDVEKAQERVKKQLSKLGETPFCATRIDVKWSQPYFISASVLNELRRNIVAKLIEIRIQAYIPKPVVFAKNEISYFETAINYKGNILNTYAARFYKRHQVKEIEYGLEHTKDYKEKALMTTKYCIRNELNQCLREHSVSSEYCSDLYLVNNQNVYKLIFNCEVCEMQMFLADTYPSPLNKGNE